MDITFDNLKYRFNPNNIKLVSTIEDVGGIESAGELIEHLKKDTNLLCLDFDQLNNFLTKKEETPKNWVGKEIIFPNAIKEERGGKFVYSLICNKNITQSGVALEHQLLGNVFAAVINKSYCMVS